MSDIAADPSFAPAYDDPVEMAPAVRRVTARNPGPFTFAGTNSYIVGPLGAAGGSVAIIDPGPDDRAHTAALLAATAAHSVSHIFVTHTHRDHTGGVAPLKAATGAITVGGGVHRPARPLLPGEAAFLDAAADTAFAPDLTLADGAVVVGEGWALEAIATPGHTANHLCFALSGGNLIFSGDHVMAWSTTIVAPPDGAMADYMASLDRLLQRPEQRYLPAHGGPIEAAPARLRALKHHRRMRERAILDRVRKGDSTIAAIVATVYRDTDPALHGAAALSVLAHLEDLVARGAVATAGPPTLAGTFRAA